MPFYQNVFENDFFGHFLLGDRQYVLDFKVPANLNKSMYACGWANPPYNTVGNTDLTFNYSLNAGQIWQAFVVTLTSGAAQTADQIVADLNANTNFASLFTATVIVVQGQNVPLRKVMIQGTTSIRERFKFYISNTSAETILRFNQKAGVAQMPSYFERHTIENFIEHGPGGDNLYPDSLGTIIALTQPTDNFYIEAAGLSTVALADYELLAGRSGLFTFKKITVDGSNRMTSVIEYPAGAPVGSLAKRTQYTYTGANTTPNQITEIPYVMTSGDYVTP